MAKVFVSYARPDRDRVKSLVKMLEDCGWSVWWDREIVPGETFEKLIDDEIQAASCVVAVWTENSVDSDWVQAEAGDGFDRGILVPVKFDEVRVPVAFRRKDAANLIGWPHKHNQSEVERFLSGVAQHLDQEHQLPADYRPSPVTRSWLRNGLLGATLAALLALAYVIWPNQPSQPVEDGPVTVSLQHFEDALERGLGLEYELERRLRASPGLAVRVSEEGVADADYVVRAVLRSDMLSIELFDRNGVGIYFNSEAITDDLDSLADVLARDLLVRLGRGAEVVSRFAVDVPAETFRAYLAANRLLRQDISLATLETAERTYLQVIEQEPRFAAAHAGLCRTYLWRYIESRDAATVAQAEQYCHRALTLDDQDSTVHVALGMLYRENGMNPQSVDSYRRALALAPYSTDAMRGLGETLSRSGAQDEAGRWLRDAIAHEPNYWENYHALGKFQYEQGDFGLAEDAFLAALALAPSESRVLNNLGSVRYMTNDFAAAVRYWERSLSSDSSTLTLMNLGSAYFFLRDYGAAAEMYLQARELSPDNHLAWGHLGDAQQAGGIAGYEASYKRAIELATQQLTIDPSDPWTRSSLAAYHAALAHHTQARKYLSQVVDDEQGAINVQYDVAVAYARLGDKPQAIKRLDGLVAQGYSAELIGRDANFDTLDYPREAGTNAEKQ